DDERQVRVLRLAQRRRHADVDRVEGLDDAEVGRRREPTGLHLLGDLRIRHVDDVGAPATDRVDLLRVDIDADRMEPRPRELERQRQPDIPEPDDPTPSLAPTNLIDEILHPTTLLKKMR